MPLLEPRTYEKEGRSQGLGGPHSGRVTVPKRGEGQRGVDGTSERGWSVACGDGGSAVHREEQDVCAWQVAIAIGVDIVAVVRNSCRFPYFDTRSDRLAACFVK